MAEQLVVLAAACCVPIIPSAAAAHEQSVLVIYSNDRLLPANIEVDEGLREGIALSAGRNVELFAEFLGQPAFSGPAYEQTVATYLRDKYVSHPPQTIVVAGQFALAFLLRHRAQVFPDVPVVHVAASQSFVQSIQPLPANVVGIPTAYDYAGTIQQALRWHPNTRRLIVVTGASLKDRDWEADSRSALGRIGTHPPVEFLSGLPTDAVLRRLREMRDGDVVFTPGYFLDGAGRTFIPRESVALLATSSNVPVYGPYSTFIGTGVVGGSMPTFIDMGREAGKVVGGLLDGTPPAALRLPSIVPASVQIDWRQARRWGIDTDAIPADAIVHFRAPTFWETNRRNAIAVLSVILVQAALITALLIERRLRRRTASALDESEQRMNLAARAAGMSVWSLDMTHDWVSTTERPQQSRGLSKDPPLRFDQLLETVHPADRDMFSRAFHQAAETGGELDVEYRLLQPSGETRWIAARGRTANGAGECLTGVSLNITARKAAELQAETDRAALTHMTRVSTMGQLSASIAHQLNQPLAAILGNAEAARKILGKERIDVAELQDICNDIIADDLRAAEVIRRLSALYKRGEMQLAPLNLNDLVIETLDLVRAELMTRHVIVVTELGPSLPAIDAGRVQLQQVLLNLILNAADAMNETAAAERMVTVRTELQGDEVRLCVVDKGTGIAPEDLKNVFQPFWGTKAGGTGVGLAICQSIIGAHRGVLTVTNNPGGGATFCARWPARHTP